jgi:hypothetical protein
MYKSKGVPTVKRKHKTDYEGRPKCPDDQCDRKGIFLTQLGYTN